MNAWRYTAIILFASYAYAAQAQENKIEENTSRVEISSYKGPELRSYSQMLKGLVAYQEKHQLAPDSELHFILIPKSKNVGIQGLIMRLASDESSVNIPIDAEGKFQLPLIALKSDDEYDLILNKPKGQFYIKPYVKSANLPDDVKRLGDLRLECQVRWAIEKQDVSIVFSTYVKLLASGNPCTARAVAVWFFAPRGVDTISLETPKTKLPIKVESGGYTVPLWDVKFEDDSLVKYERAATSVSRQDN